MKNYYKRTTDQSYQQRSHNNLLSGQSGGKVTWQASRPPLGSPAHSVSCPMPLGQTRKAESLMPHLGGCSWRRKFPHDREHVPVLPESIGHSSPSVWSSWPGYIMALASVTKKKVWQWGSGTAECNLLDPGEVTPLPDKRPALLQDLRRTKSPGRCLVAKCLHNGADWSNCGHIGQMGTSPGQPLVEQNWEIHLLKERYTMFSDF
ncbi:hypothetical protein E2C01_034120 [Portunus trituberculatus]|uniref:Uncharacterized protein n=1 Tax=Portunus trituberculatus TaxID=210409 RepID=A0A5B7F614_PORTR|nr:hypothetical protein [Portunus trituberculatus]